MRTRPPVDRALVTSLALVIAGLSASVATATPAHEPPLRIVAASSSLMLPRYPDTGEVWLDLGGQAVAGRQPFEVRLHRDSYSDPITVTQTIGNKTRDLPSGLADDYTGFPAFTHIKIVNSAGRTVRQVDQKFCPNTRETVRARPDAPERSPYPYYCPQHPLTVGSAWGIQAGWSSPVGQPTTVKLAEGTYRAIVTIAPRYRDAFDITADNARFTVNLTVRNSTDEDLQVTGAHPGGAANPNAEPPRGAALVPAGRKPNLRPLPAWQIGLRGKSKTYLSFAANVWNAGPSPLVIDGFRRSDEAVMDAYQYYYNDNGKQIGHAPTGTLEWDVRDGHHHWHFSDFARYRLLDASKQVAVRSQKQGFCLANTNAINYSVPNANWQPGSTDFETACGTQNSLAVRERLDVGSGDTYMQSRAGQAFNITNLPNGTYYIEVTANPSGVLHEVDRTDNRSLRKIILGGRPGVRTVAVPPYQGVDTEN